MTVLTDGRTAAESAPSRRRRVLGSLAFLALVGIALAVAIGVSYTFAHDDLRHLAETELAHVADLKVDDLVEYRSQLMSDGQELAQNPTFVKVLRLAIQNRQDAAARQDLAGWLSSFAGQHGYEVARVLDPYGMTFLTTPGWEPPVASSIAARTPALLQSGAVTLEDFYRSDVDGRVHLAVLAPIVDNAGDGPRPLGLVELSVDPTVRLYPAIQAWNVPSSTAETILVRREGDAAVYLNLLRFRADAALSLRVPLRDAEAPAARAVLGNTGPLDGRDYRDVPIISVTRAVPDSPWYLVAKMDTAEAQAPLTSRVLVSVLIMALVMASVASGAAVLWRRQEILRLRERLEADRKRGWLVEVIDRSRDAIYVIDPETNRIRYANNGASQDLGYSRAELTTFTSGDFAPEFTGEGFADVLASLRREPGRVVAVESFLRRRDGTDYPVMLRFQLVETETGTRCLAYAENITERRRLQAERDRMLAAIEQSSDAVMVLGQDRRITYANEAMLTMSGFSREELYSQTPAIMAGPAATAPSAGWKAMGAGTPWSGNITAHARDGHTFEAEWSMTPIRDASGELTGHVAVARDRSRERALEVQVARIQRMESIGQLAAGIAHDFNNLLTAASGYAELLRDPLPEGDSTRDDLDQIIAATDRGASLVRQLLAFSRRQVLQPEVLDLNTVIDGIAPMLGRLLGEDIDLSTRLEPEIGRLMADRSQVEQILVNLTTNARDAMPNGGKLTVETGNVDLGQAYADSHAGVVPGPYVLLAVSDTGVGMDASTIAHMFEPFFTTKGPDRGTGLGLATVHGIVNQSGGHVWAYSEPGQGTSFKVYLPRIDGNAVPLPRVQASSPAGGSETVLLVEDEKAVRVFVTRVLERQGYRVIAKAGPHEVLALHPEELAAADLLLTDMVMPGLSGPELAAILLDRVPGLRVLCMSGYAAESAAHQGLGGVASEFLAKPFTPDALARKVRDLLDVPSA